MSRTHLSYDIAAPDWHSRRRALLTGVPATAAASVLLRLQGFVAAAVLAHLLTPTEFGLAALTIVLAGVLSLVGDLGVTAALQQRYEITESNLSSVFWFNLTVTTAASLLTVGASYPIGALMHQPQVSPFLAALAAAVPVSSLGQVSRIVLQRTMRFRTLAAIDTTAGLSSTIIAIVLALQGAGVWALVSRPLTLAILTTAGLLATARWRPLLEFHWHSVSSLLSFGSLTLTGNILNYVARNADNALIGIFLGAHALGLYNLSYTLALLPTMFVQSAVQSVVSPLFASLQRSLDNFRDTYIRLVRMNALVGLPLVFGLAALSPLFIPVAYGPAWGHAIPILEILSIVGALEILGTSVIVFSSLGRLRPLLTWAAMGIALQTAFFAIAVHWGVVAVAWSYVAISPIVYVGPHVLANRMIRLSTPEFVRAFIPALFGATLMSVCLRMLLLYAPHPASSGVALLLLILAGGLLYVGALVGLGTVLGYRGRSLLSWFQGVKG